MEFAIRTGQPARIRTGCLVAGLFEDGQPGAVAQEIDEAADGLLGRLRKRKDLPRKAGETVVLHDLPGVSAERVLLVGCGKADDYGIKAYRKAVSAAVSALARLGAEDALLALAPEGTAPYPAARHAVEAASLALYRFDELKSKNKDPDPVLGQLVILTAGSGAKTDGEKGIAHGRAVAKGTAVARRLADLPANHCTPSYLASYARQLARKHKKLTAKVLSEADMKKEGMGALLSVTAGSREPAKLIVLEYKGAGKAAPVALVGKGVTFDSGGISLKPAPAMDEMKFDMGGAAGVLGTMVSLAELDLELNVVALVPACENMPDASATHPGDIVKSLSGQTIEILNTDAEGRLILCDTLTYARRYKPAAVVDVATLTGACVIALGHHLTGLMSRSDDLAADLLAAGEAAEDRAWRLPLTDEYDKELKSNFADFPNVSSGREGGAITAACFLSRFTEGLEWAHLDIAGTAWKSGSSKGGTGRPVPLLTQFLMARAGVA